MPRVVQFMRTLNELGCLFALDDFGSGLSPFTYLKNLPANFLKIDGTLVSNMLNNPADYVLVKAINDLGHTMNMLTIAESVETDACREAIMGIGVDYAQGYVVDVPTLWGK